MCLEELLEADAWARREVGKKLLISERRGGAASSNRQSKINNHKS
jgi:hypothetical protein